MSDAFARLQSLLRQLFQFESKELDFGIYRIMNHKRGAIEDFIRNGLPQAVDAALRDGAAARQSARAEEVRQKAEQVRETLDEDAIDSRGDLDPDYSKTRVGREYLEAQSKASGAVDLEDLKAEIFNHVNTFFSRYYDDGDFLSKQRYSRRQKYAIPYNGEEVYLHWANADQYYVKTGEHFTDYRYKSGGVTVHFELTAADTEQNNVKGERRYFVPRAKDSAYDGETGVLTVPFEYRPLTAKEQTGYGGGNGQDRITENVLEALPARFQKHPDALAALVSERRKSAKGEPVSLLEHHLGRYTRRNTSDFFVHKDLKGFLEGELDFYLKNEVLDVDDLDAWGSERSESWFEVMRAVKRVGRGVIAFLAQIEDFQKMLFEKKKLVVSTGYCITLDRVPEELLLEVAANDAQRDEWVSLFAIDEIEQSTITPGYSEPLTEDFLKANTFLLLDTKHFDEDFRDRLLASIEDLDEQTNGLLIESENFQALNLLQERYREQVKCIYIDPPYNTGNDGFLYKDTYQHSSWLTMMEDRAGLARNLMREDSALFAQIGDEEVANLKRVLNRAFGEENFRNAIIVRRGIKNVQAQFESISALSVGHDTVYLYTRDAVTRLPKLTQISEEGEPGKWDTFWRGTDRKTMRYEIFGVKPETGQWRWSENRAQKAKADHEEYLDKFFASFTLDEHYLEKLKEGSDLDFVRKNDAGVIQYYVPPRNYKLLSDIWLDVPTRGSFTDFPTEKNVALLRMITSWVALSEDNVLDYFAGSGTTGHAVIDLNREDGGNRKYILVEMGEYFDSVLKPRIMKVIYSKDWKDGKPVSREGTSHLFKYMKLESYEDALNNIDFSHEAEGQGALELYGDDYLLRYMLDFETRGSETLLNVGKLAAPFRYTLRLREGDGETREVPVDLPETFAYLLGMRVGSRRAYHDGGRRYLVYRGSTPERGEISVVWRDTEGWGEADFERDKVFVEESGLTGGAGEVFVNGDSFIPGARPLEGVFKARMLAGPVVG